MLKEIYSTKQALENNIARLLECEAERLTNKYAGKWATYWEMDHNGAQHKKIGCIQKVVLDVDVYAEYFVSIGLEFTGGSWTHISDVSEIK